jgi:hypothetical protein
MPHEVDLLLAEASAEVVRHRQRVGHKLIQVQALRWDVGAVGEPRTALLPPDHGEVLVKTRGVVLREEVVGHAAMDVEQHGIARVLALDEHSLLDTVDVDVDLLRDADRQRLPLVIQKRRRTSRAPEQQDAHENEHRSEQDRDDDQQDTPNPPCEPSGSRSIAIAINHHSVSAASFG